MTVLKYGFIPKSVAIIMDGNRRFAKNKGDEAKNGHEMGMKKVIDITEWAIALKIEELCLYAFSIDNFNRTKEEIDDLFNLIKSKFYGYSEKGELFEQRGIKIKFIGNFTFLNEEMREIINEIEKRTQDNSNLIVNIFFSYNSTEEMNQLRKKIINENEPNKMNIENYEEFINNKLYMSREPDLLIRTSGETRLSNFLLYQLRYSQIFFEPVLWPDFTLWNFLNVIIKYNLGFKANRRNINNLKNN
jgi:ditrans,polycis-polyprenyl diphosphate synthase